MIYFKCLCYYISMFYLIQKDVSHFPVTHVCVYTYVCFMFGINYVKASFLQDNGRPLPKFGEWDVNDPASAEGFTVIFNKARNEKRTGGKPESPPNNTSTSENNGDDNLGKNQPVSLF